MDHDELVRREEAVERVLSLRGAFLDDRPTEPVPIDRIAGRTLTDTVVADVTLPPHSHATMDGFAFDATADGPRRIVADVYPEDDPSTVGSDGIAGIRPDEAVRIATGAPLPDGANAVIKREDATVEDEVLADPGIDSGTYVYERGTNVTAGETLFRAGERLTAKDAILLRDVGVEEVAVFERLSVGVLATGTEIHEGQSADLDSPMLAGLVRSWGHDATYEGTVPDEYDRVEARIDDLATEYDVVFTTGGTSVGRKDYVVRALAALGDVRFHGVRIRPGKPIAVATLPDHDAVAFAIPGKPVGAYTIATAVVRPFFTGDGTLPGIDARVSRDVGIGREGFEYWVPVTLDRDAIATPTGRAIDDLPDALPLGHVDSPLPTYEGTFDPSVLSSSTRATRADGFFVTESGVTAGETVRVVPYGPLE